MLRNVSAAALAVCLAEAAAADIIDVPRDYPTIQAAIAASASGDEIIVAPGVYHETIDLLGKAITLRSADGAGATTIDASGLDASVVTCASGEARSTVVEGFTITGGTGTEIEVAPNVFYRYGGGMYSLDSGPTVKGCTFAYNVADSGGGLYSNDTLPFAEEDAPLLRDCEIIGNMAIGGGGMTNIRSDPVLIGCSFRENTAAGSGGGIYGQWGSDPLVIGCSFIGNSAAGWGGGIYSVDGSIPTVINGRFIGNTASYGGGMNNHNFSNAVVTNCLFAGNSANRAAACSIKATPTRRSRTAPSTPTRPCSRAAASRTTTASSRAPSCSTASCGRTSPTRSTTSTCRR